jgi:hypothetical protein
MISLSLSLSLSIYIYINISHTHTHTQARNYAGALINSFFHTQIHTHTHTCMHAHLRKPALSLHRQIQLSAHCLPVPRTASAAVWWDTSFSFVSMSVCTNCDADREVERALCVRMHYVFLYMGSKGPRQKAANVLFGEKIGLQWLGSYVRHQTFVPLKASSSKWIHEEVIPGQQLYTSAHTHPYWAPTHPKLKFRKSTRISSPKLNISAHVITRCHQTLSSS